MARAEEYKRAEDAGRIMETLQRISTENETQKNIFNGINKKN